MGICLIIYPLIDPTWTTTILPTLHVTIPHLHFDPPSHLPFMSPSQTPTLTHFHTFSFMSPYHTLFKHASRCILQSFHWRRPSRLKRPDQTLQLLRYPARKLVYTPTGIPARSHESLWYHYCRIVNLKQWATSCFKGMLLVLMFWQACTQWQSL